MILGHRIFYLSKTTLWTLSAKGGSPTKCAMYKRFAHRVILETLTNSQPEPTKEGEGGEEQETIGGGEKQMLTIVRIVHHVIPTPQSSSSSSSSIPQSSSSSSSISIIIIIILFQHHDNHLEHSRLTNLSQFILSLSAINICTHNSNGNQPGKGGGGSGESRLLSWGAWRGGRSQEDCL